MQKRLIAGIVIALVIVLAIWYSVSSGDSNNSAVNGTASDNNIPSNNIGAGGSENVGIETQASASSDSGANAPSSPSSPSSNSASKGDFTVHITNYAFTPAELVISNGSTVTWINDEITPHVVSTVSGTRNPFASHSLNKGQTFVFTFNEKGTYNYQSDIDISDHPEMTGKIVVQ